MKKILSTIFVTAFVALSVSAQSSFIKGDKTVGGSLVLGGDEVVLVGIGGKFQYNVTNPIRLEASLMLFPEQDSYSMTDYSAYFHYLFPVGEGFTLYPLAGLGSTKVSFSYSSYTVSQRDFNLRLGGGIDYLITDNWFLNGEVKAHLFDDGYIEFVSVGVAYKF